ncbi:MAG TPA: hypothetical protein P5108_01075 [Marmoricola sp.]|mgnify:FL=1|jgi:uncharacterized membrane protein YeaQ/YmgE (transglycosylase-associated protein family)|nr:hypothetical protein [Nocardioidaceae bacterium]MCB8993879.1 hypothetical protein [Nocardioidaceae bacterium]MCO5325102.1 hypothetical protein [Nocardioidaceae bacterium]HRV68020.1 hypothetical protein [Marmoricola sp.]
MLAYIVVGIIMGWLAWQLKHGNGKEMAKLPALILFGIVGAVVGGVGMNLLIFNENIFAVEAWSFAAAAIVSLVVLGVLQAGVGRKR